MDGTDEWPYIQYTAGRCYEDDDNDDDDDDDTVIQGIVTDVHNTCTW